MENPYASPRVDGPSAAPQDEVSPLVRHVRIVAFCLMIQGALEVMLGLGCLLMAAMITVAGGRATGVPQETLWMGMVFYGLAGLSALATGGLRIIAGIRNLKYRGRVLGIVAVSCGFLTMMTGLCAPTSIAMLIYGLIVYLNSDVARAFEMAAGGMPPREVRARLGV